MVKNTRVDLLLVERGLAESRSLAQRLVMAGQVRANGQIVDKPSSKINQDAELTVDQGPQFVSRGGDKLQAAFEKFGLDVSGLVCADVGASTGGFTDCLLQHGAARVYAIDVGKGILHWNLRNDPRVVVMESTNARYLEKLPEPVEFVTIDASFISLKILLPAVKNWGKGEILALIKPQFEAGRKDVSRGKGVVRDPEIHRRVLTEILAFAQKEGYQIKGLARSPVLGAKGNVEFLGWFGIVQENDHSEISIETLVSQVVNVEEIG
jgi:23S rRNA (cytidine1920-2'-O)/16S rRNA (cytidine1409-2'-O)-methyltransferase